MRDDIFCLIFWCYVPLGYLSPISGLSQVNVRKIWSKYQENIRHISGKFPIYLRLTKGINSAYLKHISSISQANSRLVFPYLRQISGIFEAYLRHVSVSPSIFLTLSVYTHQLFFIIVYWYQFYFGFNTYYCVGHRYSVMGKCLDFRVSYEQQR